MASCTACSSQTSEVFYSPSGDTLCRTCFNAGQIQTQNARAQASIAQDAPPGFKASAQPRTETPEGRTRAGFLLLACCVASTVLTSFWLNRVYLASGLLGLLAFGAFARALSLKKQQRASAGVVVLGIVASAVVLLGIVAVTILGF